MGENEIVEYFAYLATQRHVSALTQIQALNALLFLYRKVLKRDLPWLKDVVRAKQPVRIPNVPSRPEILTISERTYRDARCHGRQASRRR